MLPSETLIRKDDDPQERHGRFIIVVVVALALFPALLVFFAAAHPFSENCIVLRTIILCMKYKQIPSPQSPHSELFLL